MERNLENAVLVCELAGCYNFYGFFDASSWEIPVKKKIPGNTENGQIWIFSHHRIGISFSKTPSISKVHTVGGCTNHSISTKWAMVGNPQTMPPQLEGLCYMAGWKQRGVYLLCYQEVIAESFSGANGPQEEDKDQIQEPPAGHRQYTTPNYKQQLLSVLIHKVRQNNVTIYLIG